MAHNRENDLYQQMTQATKAVYQADRAFANNRTPENRQAVRLAQAALLRAHTRLYRTLSDQGDARRVRWNMVQWIAHRNIRLYRGYASGTPEQRAYYAHLRYRKDMVWQSNQRYKLQAELQPSVKPKPAHTCKPTRVRTPTGRMKYGPCKCKRPQD